MSLLRSVWVWDLLSLFGKVIKFGIGDSQFTARRATKYFKVNFFYEFGLEQYQLSRGILQALLHN